MPLMRSGREVGDKNGIFPVFNRIAWAATVPAEGGGHSGRSSAWNKLPLSGQRIRNYGH